jgi:hypothetical protein
LATESSETKVFQILAVSGGGYLGLYAAELLARLEARAGKPLGRCFDLIAGTSVGGILAASLALEIPINRVRDVFVERGEQIFSNRPRPKVGWIDAGRSLFSSKYDGLALRSVISEILGEETRVSAAKHRLLVPAVNMTKPDDNGVVHASAVIKQDLLRISMEVSSRDSDSETLVAYPKRDPESGRPILYYVYRVVPKSIGPDPGHSYEGAAIIKLSNERVDQLSGNYFTSRQTNGYFHLIRSTPTPSALPSSAQTPRARS